MFGIHLSCDNAQLLKKHPRRVQRGQFQPGHKRTDKYTAEEERGPLYFGGGTGLSQILGKEDLL